MTQTPPPTSIPCPEPETPGNWTSPFPIANIDRYLLGLRWVIILVAGIPSLFGGFQHNTPLPPGIVLGIIILYNAPLSVYIWQKRPLANRKVRGLLAGDTPQAALSVVVTGGYASFFFVLFMLAAVEIALS
ncbi:MAG TPA: hypothetical protein ENK24_07195, partial [Anaerolineae bacterium]|nr:hypothetical protein [Anaerolineae bacterium]